MSFFRSAVQALLEARGPIGTALFIFVAGAVLGVLAPEYGQPLLQSLQSLARELAQEETGGLIMAIFFRNASAAVIAVSAGILFGVVPAFGALANGILFGTVLEMAPGEVWKVLPHGIFELPAMFAAWGVGLWIGQWPFGPERLRRLGHRFAAGLRALVAIILPLLVVAAAIEGLIAAHLFGRF